VVKGEIPSESAKVLIQAAYPALEESEIDEMLKAAEEQEPPAPPQPVAPTAPVAEPPKEPEKPKQAQAFRGVIEDVAERMTKRLGIAARKAAKKPNEFLNWLDNELPTHTSVIADALGPVVTAWRAMGSEGPLAEDIAVAWMNRWRAELLRLSGECNRDTMQPYMEGALSELEPTIRQFLITSVLGSECNAQEPPSVVIHNHVAAPVVNVAASPAPQVNMAAPVVNVAAAPTPDVHVAAPVVNVAPAQAPVVNIAAPPPANVTVERTVVNVAPPAVHLEAPEAPVINLSPVFQTPPRSKRVKRDKDGRITEVIEEDGH
jgi:hypothetical protein